MPKRIVTDERRRHVPDFARPVGVGRSFPLDGVACLQWPIGPCCAALLVSGTLRPITAIGGHEFGP